MRCATRRGEARKTLANGVDPSAKRQAEKSSTANTFEAVAKEWLALQEKKLAPATYAKAQWTLETLVCPYIGSRPIAKLGATDVLKVLKRIEGRGIHETAHRSRQRCSQVFRCAVQTERAAHDVTADLRGALAPVVSEHHAAITEPARIGELLRAIDGYTGHTGTAYALKLAPLKMREQHLVPLSKQAVALLRELQPATGRGPYVFPSLRSRLRPMSNNTVNAALRRLGYPSDEMTGHGSARWRLPA